MNRKPIGLSVPYRKKGERRELNCHGISLFLEPRSDGKWEWVVSDKEFTMFQQMFDDKAKEKS